MKKLTLSIFVLLAMLTATISLNATHIVGGDMTYKCLGNDQYEITLELRRDCYFGDAEAQFDDPAVIGIFRTSDSWFMKGLGTLGSGILEIPLSFNDTLNETVTSMCGFQGEQVCVETTTYKSVVTLPFLQGGYTLVYQRCCRNQSLNNIVDPLDTGSAQYVEISAENQISCNSSPTFDNWASVYICKDEQLTFDQSATDIDGDSLVYSLCAPHIALSADENTINSISGLLNNRPPYDVTIWSAPYDLDNLLGGTPLTIDSNTGLMTAIPNLIGQFLVGVCVKEYRNGTLIGETRRDFEYNVRSCSAAPTVDFTYTSEECGSLDVQFTNTTTGADTYEWDFDFPNGVISTEENPSHTYTQGGTYTVALTATRSVDGCSITTTKDINIDGESVTAAYDAFILECSANGNKLQLKDKSISTSNYDRTWNVTQGANVFTSSDESWIVNLDVEQDVEIQLIVGSGACMDTLTKTYSLAELKPSVDVSLDIIECIGDSIRVKINAVFSTPDTSIHLLDNSWELLTGFSGDYNYTDVTMATITILNIDFVDVTIHATADNGCDINYTETIDPDEVKIELALAENPYILCEGDSTRIISNPNTNWTYTWEPTTGLTFESVENLSNPWAKPTETTTYNVTVTDGVCTKDTSITIMVLASLDLAIEGNTVLCDGQDVKLWVVGDAVGVMDFEWSDNIDFTNIIHVGDTLITTFTGTSTTYYVRAEGGVGCMDGVTNVEVIKDDFTVEITEPNVVCVGDEFAIDVISTGLDLTYIWESSPYIISGSDTKNPTISVTDGATDFVLNFTATNSNGCTYTGDVSFNIEEVEPMSFTSSVECGTYKICFTSTGGVADDLTSWDFGDPVVTTDVATGNSVCYTYPSAGDYVVTLSDLTTVCSKSTIEQTISVLELLNINVDQNSYVICEGESITMNTTGNGNISYCDIDGNEISTDNPFDYSPGESQTVIAKVTDANGCQVVDTISIVVNTFEGDLDLVVEPEHEGYAGQVVDLNVTGGLDGYLYEWDPTGETTSTISVGPLETTTYIVTVTDENGCTEVLSTTLTINQEVKCTDEDIFLPTAFSPNDDGENEIFRVRSNVLSSMELIVYDRWGEEIYKTTNISDGWDGTFKGSDCSPDVYAFCMRAVCKTKEAEKPYVKIGNVSLLR